MQHSEAVGKKCSLRLVALNSSKNALLFSFTPLSKLFDKDESFFSWGKNVRTSKKKMLHMQAGSMNHQGQTNKS